MEKELTVPTSIEKLRDDFSELLESLNQQQKALLKLFRPEHLFQEQLEAQRIMVRLNQAAIDHFSTACDKVSDHDARERESNYNFAIIRNATKIISKQIAAFEEIPETTPNLKAKQKEVAAQIVENLSNIQHQSADLNSRSLDLRTNQKQARKKEVSAVAALKDSLANFKFSADLYTEALDKLVTKLNDKGFTKIAEQLEAATAKLYTALTENNNASIRLASHEESAKKISDFIEVLNEITVQLNKHSDGVESLPKGSVYAGLDDDGKRVIDSISLTTADLSVKIDELRKAQPEKLRTGARR